MRRKELFLDGEPATYLYIQRKLGCSESTVIDRIKRYGRNLTTKMFARTPRAKAYDYSEFEEEETGCFRPPEKKGKVEFDSYQLKTIELPETMTEEDMKPYRELANAVIASAFIDLVPTRPRTQASMRVEQARVQLAISNAYRFLSGESGTDRLSLWCALSGQPMWKIKARVKDREEIVKHMRILIHGAGRGRGRGRSRKVAEVVA